MSEIIELPDCEQCRRIVSKVTFTLKTRKSLIRLNLILGLCTLFVCISSVKQFWKYSSIFPAYFSNCYLSIFKTLKCKVKILQQHLIDHNEFIEDVKSNIISILKDHLHHFVSLKINCELFALYRKPEADTKSFITKNELITQFNYLKSTFDNLKLDIVTKVRDFLEKNSDKLTIGYYFFSLLHLVVNLIKNNIFQWPL